jgi:uncharacterized protein RhaS with RHS repeats
MALRYAKTPQLNYGSAPSAVDRLVAKIPQGAQSIASAPQASATPVQVIDADGKIAWCLYHRDGWRKLAPDRDSKTGATQWRMDGTSVRQPIGWIPPRQK